ncbi:hypothetical protein M2459_001897 [Parabacteroides sp. PF5-5]|uniref:RagB/SusD family nutrient uptake outer membrane protein n=1 Tax=unclassified Parabacteroides TaxID=2649774 RepID=UPI00247722A0|nr:MULTISPECIES: RagB/SusD family nutrient uptake outer membrane protein [unclassified Parabacteroides]MDH6305444.1 hypothetical protein [Parabacteroides sp. PH5-39]MDH6316154.1 hypothetical protein [Parabacteroides sp. PF5-13]MDH6320304.1 hypothetical protein [Parabacteroides sp. PH5-13]MDH6324034.1 hypothetical protein [Parabacteroides sp. PH5-8]MDH6327345.1 hypothetical protein [Parabacteroides sp. PH5-41]
MKIKKISTILSAALLVLSSACTNLDEKVYSEAPVDQFGLTIEEVEALIGPLYATLRSYQIDWDGYTGLCEISSDVWESPGFKGGDWGEPMFHHAMLHTLTPINTEWNRAWEEPMGAISQCNQLYYMVSTNEIIPEATKSRILAEIRGVRAFWYYWLCDMFGNVPIVTDYLDKSLPSTNSRSEVFNFIVSELLDIVDELRTDVATAGSYGKFTQGVAYTLLAKMYLNAQVWNPSGGTKWQECIEACDKVMDMAYLLENNWKNNFSVNNDSSKEAIFSAIYSSEGIGGRTNGIYLYLHYLTAKTFGINVSTWNGPFANPDYVKAFDTEDIRYEGSFLIGEQIDPETGEVFMTQHGRPLIHTVEAEMKEIGENGLGWVEQEEGARISKWEYQPGLTYSMENDIHIFRLADIYLMKAEAILRSNGDVAEATQLVNRIRQRGFPNSPEKLYDSVTLEEVYKERRFEFAFECMNRQDMIRFGTYLAARPPFKPKESDPAKLLFPIPQTVINANPNIKQNPGY